MSEIESHSRPAIEKVAPTLQLSSRGLAICLLTMVVVGIGVYVTFPESVGGPPLPINVRLDQLPVATTDGQGAMMTEVVVIENLTQHEIQKLTLSINGQYLYLQDSPLATAETLVLPQRVFTDKRSSQRFNPTKYAVEEITATGQLPSGARGVSEFEFHE